MKLKNNKFVFVALAVTTIIAAAVLVGSVHAVELGDSCVTPHRESGRCLVLSRCDSLYRLFKAPPISAYDRYVLTQSHCGWLRDQPLVCCSQVSQQREQYSVDTRVGSSSLPHSNECGIQNLDRVVGGSTTGIGELPWVALLRYKNAANAVAFHCGATLISHQHVITAGHCITGHAIHRVWTPTEVRLGKHLVHF